MTPADNYVIVSLSGGKDSTAMLLKMFENNEHIDEVLTCDTGMEFPEMYEHLNRLYAIIKDRGIKLTVLQSPFSFEYLMLEQPIKSEKYGDHLGFGWPSVNCRWCTKHLKLKLINDYLKIVKKEHDNIIQCVGLASDETKRLQRENNKKIGQRHPLVEYGMTEKDCLNYCYSQGYNWGGLYEIFKRVSCWCCPLANLSELKNLWWYYPELWRKLEQWELEMSKDNVGKRGRYWFKDSLTVFDLSARFAIEKKREMQNKNNKRISKEVKSIIRELPKNQTTLTAVLE